MWTRKELKKQAKQAFKRNYWKCVLAALILSLVVGSTGVSWTVLGRVTDASSLETLTEELGASEMSAEEVQQIVSVVSAILLMLVIIVVIGSILGILLGIFVRNPFEVGGCHFFLQNASHPAVIGDLMFGFRKGNYKKAVSVQFFRGLYTSLWSLLLLIPGIVKSYEYAMIPYILAENPAIRRKEAFARSKAMMRSNKWRVFVLDLSFVGWFLLNSLTFGLLGLFYINPYRHATMAELYWALKKEY